MKRQVFTTLAFVAAIILNGCIVRYSTISPTLSIPASPIPSTFTPLTTSTQARALTELEAIDAEMQAKYGSVHPDCSTCMPLPEGSNCSQYLWTKSITRSEWTELFPNTHFYLLGFHQIVSGETNRYGYQRHYTVIAQQDSLRYTAETFDRLLDANEITATDDEKRESVAKAFALMMLADYLEEDITFSNWTQGDWPARFGAHFNYSIFTWTRIQGLRTQWYFWFDDGHLKFIRRMDGEYHVGSYTDIPFDVLHSGFQEFWLYKN